MRTPANGSSPWGLPPWRIDFQPKSSGLPGEVDIAIVGGGFTGLAAAAWLRLLSPELSVAVLEAGAIGRGASGRTGGLVLGETAAGDLPGLGDVLAGFRKILEKLGVRCDLRLDGAWEIGRSGGIANSPIEWQDSGTLRVVKEVAGGTLDPGKMVSGLARAAEQLGAHIFERRRVRRIRWKEWKEIEFSQGRMRARKILFATNALSLELAGLTSGMHPRLTLAAMTAPVGEDALNAIGLAGAKPFYTVDLPYLWGRLRPDRSIVWGAGLVSVPDSCALEELDIAQEEPARLFRALEERIRRLHPALRDARFTHCWGGPILFRDSWTPVFDGHPESRDAMVLGAFAGHGVALSVYLGAWAAEVLLGRRSLPDWGRISG